MYILSLAVLSSFANYALCAMPVKNFETHRFI
ncbi:hypothetical protein GLYMA_18G274750v4 [Glycine max]|nr:hypothetical protein GLYMA_18G274750v4 [Glycine max]KAH1156426.1 hypothetical protein GYH30_051291 [Glycine max]